MSTQAPNGADLPSEFVVNRREDFPYPITDEQWASFWVTACEAHLAWCVNNREEDENE